jgi:hypothetical protein
MVSPDSRLIINQSEIAAQVIDGEAIIMNITTGVYCSMDRVGAVVWGWIERGHSVAEMSEGLTSLYEVPPAQAQADLERLIGQLVEDGLVRIDPVADGQLGSPVPPAESRLPYVAPELNRYGDMADLLALDPPMPVLPASPWTAPEERA